MKLKQISQKLPRGAGVPRYHRILLPCGFAFASVSKNIKPKTIAALDEMARRAKIMAEKPPTTPEEMK